MRRRALRERLALVVIGQSRPCLLMLVRRGQRTVSFWVPANLPMRPELLDTPLNRLADETAHGRAREGFASFIDQFERLSRTYVPNPENKDGGQIIYIKMP